MKLGITSQKERRLRGDMIEVYKLLSGKEHIDYTQFFKLAHTHLQRIIMESEDMRRNYQKTDQDWIQGSMSSAREWSMVGTVFQQKLSIQSLSTVSRTPMTTHPTKIWTTEADQLSSPSTYKYK